MSRHLSEHLEELKGRVSRMGAMVQQVVEEAVRAVGAADVKLAHSVIAMDERVDEEEVRVEKAAIDLLALYQPAAGDLRLITTVIKVNSDLERIADCAVNAAQRVVGLPRQSSYDAPRDLMLIGNSVVAILRDAIRAFNMNDAELARHVLRNDDVVDALYQQIVHDMLAGMEGNGRFASTSLSNIMIAKNLERIADHCTNIAEDVIYVHTGKIVRHLHAV